MQTGKIYIGIILLCRVAQHMCNKKASNGVQGTTALLTYATFRNVLSAVLALFAILISGNGFRCNVLTIIISVLSGICLTASTYLGMLALRNGTVALTSMFGTAGLLIPAVAGIFMFGKPVSIGQWVGIAVFFAAAYLLISSSKKIYAGFSFKTLLLLCAVLLTEGCTMLSQQMFAQYVPNGDVSVFSFFSFGIPGVVMTFYLLIAHKGGKTEESKLAPKVLGFGVILSVAVFVINQLATLAAAVVSPVVLFTFINGGSTIIGTIVAAVVFREKLTVKSVVGVLIGVTALIMIKAF